MRVCVCNDPAREERVHGRRDEVISGDGKSTAIRFVCTERTFVPGAGVSVSEFSYRDLEQFLD